MQASTMVPHVVSDVLPCYGQHIKMTISLIIQSHFLTPSQSQVIDLLKNKSINKSIKSVKKAISSVLYFVIIDGTSALFSPILYPH